MKYSNYLDAIECAFSETFRKKGYQIEQPVAVSSRIDSSVDFVGSKISPLKHFVLNGNISTNGHALIQDCFRTKGMKKLKTVEPNKFGSCFRTMGTLITPDVEKTIFDTFDYLINGIGIKPEDLRIKISADDHDLIKATQNIAGNIKRIENATDAHYRHKYGLDESGIFGRDFNIAVRNKKTDEFISAAAVVLMEQNGAPIAVDMGIGNLTLSMCNFGEDNAIAASRMADVFPVENIEQQRLADSMMGLSMLQAEVGHLIK